VQSSDCPSETITPLSGRGNPETDDQPPANAQPAQEQKARFGAGFPQLSLENGAGRSPSGYFPSPDYLICLWPLLALDNVEFDIIALLQALVSIHLNRTVVDKHIRPIVPADKPVTLRIVEPLHLAFVLSHKREPSSQAVLGWAIQPAVE
jgi:hypothetical protein